MAGVGVREREHKRQRRVETLDDLQQMQQLSGTRALAPPAAEASHEAQGLQTELEHDWSFMSPWCEQLRGRLEMDTGGTSADGGLWVTVEPSDLRLQDSEALGTRVEQELDQLQCTREALELLALVAHVDNAAWLSLLTDECEMLSGDLNGDSGDGLVEPTANQDNELKPRFLVVVDTSSDYLQAGHVPSPAQQCDALFLRRQLPSIAFLHTKERILALQTGPSRVRCPVVVPVALQVTLWSLSPYQVGSYLQQLLEVIQAMRSADRSREQLMALDAEDDERACVFHFAFMKLYVNGSKLTQSLTARILALLEAGVPVSELSLSLNWGLASRSDKRTVRATLGNLFATMLCSSEDASAELEEEPQEPDHQQDTRLRRRRVGVASLVVECDYAHTWRFAALGSALAVGGLRSLRKLRLENVCRTHTTAARRRNWRWLALGLFSARNINSPNTQTPNCRYGGPAYRRKRRVVEQPQHAVELTGVRLSFEDLGEIHDVLTQQAGQAERERLLGLVATGSDATLRTWSLPKGTWLRLRYGVDEDDYEAVSEPMQLPREASVVGIEQLRTVVGDIDARYAVENEQEGKRRATESDWVDVLVPGYGQCRVARSSIKPSALPLSLAWQGGEPSTTAVLTSLDMSFSARTQQESAGLPGLLQLVGRSLRSLSLQLNGLDVLDALVPTLLCYCPQLKDLRLDGDNINLNTFATEYERLSTAYEVAESGELTQEDREGDRLVPPYPPPRLESLAFVNFRSRAHGTVINASRFAWRLANPESALARDLKELSIFPLEDANPLDNDTLLALFAVLEANQRLERLDLLVLPAYYETWVDSFERHNYELLPARKGPLPLRCKLAFLSLVRRAQTRMDDGKQDGPSDVLAVIGRLDRQVLSLVFEFAASCAMRMITFRSDDMG